jgi:hypothetical protein
MWSVYTIIGYFLLALLVPVVWALLPVWRRARGSRPVVCPANGGEALVGLDRWYAVRGRALGGREVRIRSCSKWPDRSSCGRECAGQIGETV